MSARTVRDFVVHFVATVIIMDKPTNGLSKNEVNCIGKQALEEQTDFLTHSLAFTYETNTH